MGDLPCNSHIKRWSSNLIKNNKNPVRRPKFLTGFFMFTFNILCKFLVAFAKSVGRDKGQLFCFIDIKFFL